jgi:hypothetical protein
MRKLPLFVLLVLSTGIAGASAQEPPTASTQQPSPPGAALDVTEQQHPEWFRETYKYRPCPADVVFQDGRHACLGTR